MQFQASYNIKDLRDLLKQRKYKYTLNKIEKILEKSSQPSYYGADFQLTLRELQLSAINKLIQRNIAKKYKYSFGLVEYLIELAYRNLDYCQQMLREAVKQRTFFSRLSCGSDLTLTINSQTYSLDENVSKGQKMRNASINMNTGIQNQQKLKEHLMNFFSSCTQSLLLMVQTFLIYKLEFDQQALLQYIQNINQLKFKKISSSLSQIHINLFYVKLLFLSSQKADLIKCEEMIDSTTEKLIDTIHEININYNKAKKRDKELAYKKYQKQLKHSQRLMAINLILNNKIQLKLGKEILALSGIAIFQGYTQGFSQKQYSFKKLLAPELYLQDQFLRYRLQKEQLLNIITPFFRQKLKQLQQFNKQKQTSKTSLLNFYNKKNTKLTQRVSYKPKTIINDLTTAKSLLAGQSKQKSFHSKEHKSSKQHSCSQSRSKLLTNMIMADIEENNSNYLKNKRKTVGSFSKRQNSKSSFYRSSLQLNQMKKHIISARDDKAQQQNTKPSLLSSERQQKLLFEECDHQNYISRQKERLVKKKRDVKIMDIDDIEFQSKIPNRKEDISVNNALWNCRYSEQKSNDLEEKDVKRNALMIPVRRKTDVFIEILFQNKDILGLKKIAEKFDLLKKKQQQKAKLSRLTSSISRQRRERHSFVKFEVIAKQILKKHMSFVYDRSPFYHTTILQEQARKKLIYANYALGQKSIDAVKQKLQNKIKKSDQTVDKYMKNEEIFKLKLKKIGTTNFILKKSNHQQKGLVENE